VLFSTIQNQSKANELVEQAKEIIQNTKECTKEAKETLLEEISKNDSIKERLIKKRLSKFQELIKKIKNEDFANIASMSTAQFCEQVKPLIEKSDIEPLSIIELKQRKVATMFTSFLASLISVVLVILIGAFAMDVPIAPETFTDIKILEDMLAWIGGGVYDPEIASSIWGAVALIFVAMITGMTTWSIMLSKISKENLKIGESMLKDAESYKNKMDEITEKMQNLTLSLQDYRKNMEIYDAYINEFNATVHRILLTEKDSLETLKPASITRIEYAIATVLAIIPHLNIVIITEENTVANQLLQTTTEAKRLVQNLVDEKPISTT